MNISLRKRDDVRSISLERKKVIESGNSNNVTKWSVVALYDIIEDLNLRIINLEKNKTNITPIAHAEIGWAKKLSKIKGIGKETILDIETIYPNEQKLINAINKGDRIPLINSIAKKLVEHYGR
jgi:endonuclease III-like uncharacterized protein